MDRRPLTREQLEEHLRVQLGHLQVSAAAVDAGNLYEYVRLASTLRILLHHYGRSRALLVQLGIRDTTAWVDSCRYRDEVEAAWHRYVAKEFGSDSEMVISANTPSQTGLVTMANDPRTLAPSWVAPLDASTVQLSSFETWWSKPGIETSAGGTFSRSQLILTMANQDGGAHVDDAISVDYDDFRSDFLGVLYADGVTGNLPAGEPPGGWKAPEGNVANSSIRQVAWEVQETIHRLDLPWLT